MLVELQRQVGHDQLMTPIVFQVTRSKVNTKVTLHSWTVSDQYLENAWAYASQTGKPCWSRPLHVDDHFLWITRSKTVHCDIEQQNHFQIISIDHFSPGSSNLVGWLVMTSRWPLLIFRSKQKQGPKSMSQQNQFQSISSECFGPGSRNLVTRLVFRVRRRPLFFSGQQVSSQGYTDYEQWNCFRTISGECLGQGSLNFRVSWSWWKYDL